MADQEDLAVYSVDRMFSETSYATSQPEGLYDFTEQERKRLQWRIDRRLVLPLGFMYAVSLMDRGNLGIAAIGGMTVDLNLIGFRYSTIALVFFIFYVSLQPPATVVLRKLGPKNFLPSITILWGLTMITFGFVKVWWQMIPLRIVLGALEAGFFPGCAYLLSCWYPRYEVHKRNAVFYLIGNLSFAFSGVLAYGFLQLKGHGDLGQDYGQHYGPTKEHPNAAKGIEPGIAGWRWIFILQGLLTVVIAFIGAFFIADFPENQTKKSRSLAIPFLNEKEANYVIARIERDRSDTTAEPFSLVNYLRCGLDIEIWGFATLFLFTTTVGYAISFFLPIILNEGMGFTVGESQCLVAPPYVLAALWMFACAWYGDEHRIRGPLIIFNACLGLIGLPLLGFAKTPAVRYFGVFLATTSCNANVPCMLSFQSNNIRGQWVRAFSSATLVGAGGLGGVVGSTVFRSQDKPGYRPGIICCIIACGGIVLVTAWLDWKFMRANKKAETEGKVLEGLPGFRYTI